MSQFEICSLSEAGGSFLSSPIKRTGSPIKDAGGRIQGLFVFPLEGKNNDTGSSMKDVEDDRRKELKLEASETSVEDDKKDMAVERKIQTEALPLVPCPS